MRVQLNFLKGLFRGSKYIEQKASQPSRHLVFFSWLSAWRSNKGGPDSNHGSPAPDNNHDPPAYVGQNTGNGKPNQSQISHLIFKIANVFSSPKNNTGQKLTEEKANVLQHWTVLRDVLSSKTGSHVFDEFTKALQEQDTTKRKQALRSLLTQYIKDDKSQSTFAHGFPEDIQKAEGSITPPNQSTEEQEQANADAGSEAIDTLHIKDDKSQSTFANGFLQYIQKAKGLITSFNQSTGEQEQANADAGSEAMDALNEIEKKLNANPLLPEHTLAHQKLRSCLDGIRTDQKRSTEEISKIGDVAREIRGSYCSDGSENEKL